MPVKSDHRNQHGNAEQGFLGGTDDLPQFGQGGPGQDPRVSASSGYSFT